MMRLHNEKVGGTSFRGAICRTPVCLQGGHGRQYGSGVVTVNGESKLFRLTGAFVSLRGCNDVNTNAGDDGKQDKAVTELHPLLLTVEWYVLV
jgi:hypothetical protein